MLPARPVAPHDLECQTGLAIGIERLARHGITVTRSQIADLALYDGATGILHICRDVGERACAVVVTEMWKHLAIGPSASAFEVRPRLRAVP